MQDVRLTSELRDDTNALVAGSSLWRMSMQDVTTLTSQLDTATCELKAMHLRAQNAQDVCSRDLWSLATPDDKVNLQDSQTSFMLKTAPDQYLAIVLSAGCMSSTSSPAWQHIHGHAN